MPFQRLLFTSLPSHRVVGTSLICAIREFFPFPYNNDNCYILYAEVQVDGNSGTLSVGASSVSSVFSFCALWTLSFFSLEHSLILLAFRKSHIKLCVYYTIKITFCQGKIHHRAAVHNILFL